MWVNRTFITLKENNLARQAKENSWLILVPGNWLARLRDRFLFNTDLANSFTLSHLKLVNQPIEEESTRFVLYVLYELSRITAEQSLSETHRHCGYISSSTAGVLVTLFSLVSIVGNLIR
jgi:hypothetical protein